MCLPLNRLICHWIVTKIRLKTTFSVTIQWPFSHLLVTIQSIERWNFILWFMLGENLSLIFNANRHIRRFIVFLIPVVHSFILFRKMYGHKNFILFYILKWSDSSIFAKITKRKKPVIFFHKASLKRILFFSKTMQQTTIKQSCLIFPKRGLSRQ